MAIVAGSTSSERSVRISSDNGFSERARYSIDHDVCRPCCGRTADRNDKENHPCGKPKPGGQSWQHVLSSTSNRFAYFLIDRGKEPSSENRARKKRLESKIPVP